MQSVGAIKNNNLTPVTHLISAFFYAVKSIESSHAPGFFVL